MMYTTFMIYEIIGWFGTALILFAYLLVSSGKITAASKVYQYLNLLGALGIIVNSLKHMAIPSVGLNIVWSLIAIYGLFKSSNK